MKGLKHPLKDVVEALRQIILKADRAVGEEIKWNAPSFFFTGEMEPSDPKLYRRYLVIFNLFRKDCVRLVFWGGANAKDPTGLLEGTYADGRRLALFRDMDAVKSNAKALGNIVRDQLKALRQAGIAHLKELFMAGSARIAATSLALVLVARAPRSAGRSERISPGDHGHQGRADLIDGRGGQPVANAVILIEGERITAVGPGVSIPAGARIIDLSKSTVLPGLIDCHTHITINPGASDDQSRRTFVDAAILAPQYARATLEAGFTTIRDLGAPQFVDVSLRNAIDRGDIPGPRIVAATMGISATGGHGDANGMLTVHAQ